MDENSALRVRIARRRRFIRDGLGVYFAFLRPSLLPEASRYIGASLAQIQSAVPGMLPWRAQVFGVLGSYIFATGTLTIYVAATSFSAGISEVNAIVAVAGLASIGWMAIANFLVDSDSKWVLLAFTLPWLLALVLSWAGRDAYPELNDLRIKKGAISDFEHEYR